MDIWHEILKQFSQQSPIEVIGAITGFLCVYYAVKNNLLTWPWGIVSVIAYGWVFYVSRYYSNMGLQLIYFLPMQFYGWWMWAKGGPKQEDDLPVSLLDTRSRVLWAGVTVLLSVVLGYLMAKYTQAMLPYWDATTTAISIVAQYFQTRKIFENWALWIVADIIYVFYLYPAQQLYLTTVLYVFFTFMAIQGYRAWWSIYRNQQLKDVLWDAK